MHKKEKKGSKNYFVIFAKLISEEVGKAWVFMLALLFVFIWLVSGPFYKFSDTWQLIINSVSSVVTFLMVFLIQNTQNRDTVILNIKLNEIIKAVKDADNNKIDLEKLSNEELEKLVEQYNKLKNKS